MNQTANMWRLGSLEKFGRGITAALIVLALLCAACSAGSGGIPKDPRKLGFDPIKFEIPEPERWELPNGLKVYYYHNDELPQTRARMYLPGGSLQDSSGIPGLAGATGGQMREGGIPGYKPDDLDKHLDRLAASIESAYGEEYGTASCFSLTEDFDHVFGLFAKVIRQPAFDAQRLALLRTLSADGITRRKDDPETMAGMAFNLLVHGESNYYRPTTLESLALLTPARLREFHKKFVRPNGARLAISGSMPREQVERLVVREFGDWQPNPEPLPPLPDLGTRAPAGVYVLERDFDQSTLIMGHRGPPRYPPDFYQILVFNNLFGHGGFGSILFKEIRSRLGLAYSIYGSIVPDAKEGTFQIIMQTRNSEVGRALSESLRLTRESIETDPNRDAFNEAKSYAQRSFVFKFAEPDSIVDRAVLLELMQYPDDYDRKYLDRIEAVTGPSVRESGKRWIEPDDLIIVAVGGVKGAELAKQLGLPAYKLEFDTLPRVKGGLEN